MRTHAAPEKLLGASAGGLSAFIDKVTALFIDRVISSSRCRLGSSTRGGGGGGGAGGAGERERGGGGGGGAIGGAAGVE